MWAYDFPFIVAAAMAQAGSTSDRAAIDGGARRDRRARGNGQRLDRQATTACCSPTATPGPRRRSRVVSGQADDRQRDGVRRERRSRRRRPAAATIPARPSDARPTPWVRSSSTACSSEPLRRRRRRPDPGVRGHGGAELRPRRRDRPRRLRHAGGRRARRAVRRRCAGRHRHRRGGVGGDRVCSPTGGCARTRPRPRPSPSVCCSSCRTPPCACGPVRARRSTRPTSGR